MLSHNSLCLLGRTSSVYICYTTHWIPCLHLESRVWKFFFKCQKCKKFTQRATYLTTYTVWIVYTVTHLLLELTVWYLSGNSCMMAASSREKDPPSHSRQHAAVSRGIKCLSDTYLETAVWRPPTHGCLTVYRTTASLPPSNGCLAG